MSLSALYWIDHPFSQAWDDRHHWSAPQASRFRKRRWSVRDDHLMSHVRWAVRRVVW